MPDREQQVTNLSERVVKEAVGVGMESPLRDPIVEAVEEANGSKPPASRRLPMAGALLGAGAALVTRPLGYAPPLFGKRGLFATTTI